MKKPIILNSIFIIIFSISLSGCSLESIFASLSGTPEEQGARQAYEQDQIIKAKQSRIDKLKSEYQQSIELKNTSDNTNYVGVAFKNLDQTQLKITVEAYLSSPGRSFYEVWLRAENGDQTRIGALEYTNVDDYAGTFELDAKLSTMSGVFISREKDADETPETVVMTGSFKSELNNTPNSQK